MPTQKLISKSFIINIIAIFLLIVFSVFVVSNRQRILDQILVWQFQPTTQVMSLVDRSGMSDNGKFIFKASQPVLDSTQNFNAVCDLIENTMSVLGCYSNNRIYIYDVVDDKLDGIREVTAAHEALHAVFYRLSDEEKAEVGQLLEEEYKKIANDASYSDRMDFYARTEPGERINELHSVVGTEMPSISAELETYYKKYFNDRQKVVSLYKKYSSVFQEIKDRSTKLADQLNLLAESINEQVVTYNNSVIKLNADIVAFNKLANGSKFDSQADFDAARAALDSRIIALDSERNSINRDIALYNKLLVEYNSITIESKKLYNSIDSTLAPAPSV